MVIQGISYPSDFEAKKAIISTAAAMAAGGSMPAGDGSISVRVGPNAVWITVEGADKAALTQDQMVRIDMNGRQMASNRPRSLGEDLASHLRIYRENENVQAVIHAYPVCAAVLSQQGTGVEAASYTPAVRKLGRVRLLPQQDPQTRAEALAAMSRSDRGALLMNDGCMVWGRTLSEAAQAIDTLDYICRVRQALSGGKCGSCHKQEPVSTCSGNCGACPDSGSCSKSVLQPAQIPGMTGLIRPGQSLPPLPEAAPAPAQSAPAAVPETPAPKEKVLAVDTPKADVMAEVVRRIMSV